jgi:hypothetical protein
MKVMDVWYKRSVGWFPCRLIDHTFHLTTFSPTSTLGLQVCYFYHDHNVSLCIMFTSKQCTSSHLDDPFEKSVKKSSVGRKRMDRVDSVHQVRAKGYWLGWDKRATIYCDYHK